MTTVTATKPGKKETGFVMLEDGTEAWTPELVKVLPLVGKPLPDGWLVKDGTKGKMLLPPKERGQGSYRNTKEAFDAEAAGRRAWQLIEQDGLNRRTALMQAVQLHAQTGQGWNGVETTAQAMYRWLCGEQIDKLQDVGAGRGVRRTRVPSGEEQSSKGGSSSVPATSEPSSSSGSGSGGEGEAPPDEAEVPDVVGQVVSSLSAPASGTKACMHLKGTESKQTVSGHWVEVCVTCGRKVA